MPKLTFPFVCPLRGDIARPYAPAAIANLSTGRSVRVFALLDTGADECAFPASYAVILGHHLEMGTPKQVGTGNGSTVAYGHSTVIRIGDYTTDEVLVDYLPNLTVPLLGVKSFLSRFRVTIDFPAKVFSLQF